MNKLILKSLFFLGFFLINTSTIYGSILQNSSKQEAKQKAEKYLELLQDFYNNGDYEMHKNYSDSLLKIASDYKFTKMHILALTNQAIFHNNRSERQKSIELYYKALEQCERIPEDFRSKIIVLVNMGNTYSNIGSYKKAIEYMENVLYLLDKHENSNNIRAAALIGISNNYSELGKFEKAIEYAEKTKKIGEVSKNQNIIASSINNICNSYNKLKQYNKALNYANAAIHMPVLNKETKKRAWLLLNLGISNYYLKNFDSSLNYLNSCVLLAEKKKTQEIEMLAHEHLLKLYEEKGDYKKSTIEHKKYIALKKILMEDEKKASNIDLTKKIISSTKQLKTVTQNKNLIITITTSILLICCILLFIYIKRKKRLDFRQHKLTQEHVSLQKEFMFFKTQKQIADKKVINNANLKPYQNSSLTPQKREKLKNKILNYMNAEKPFLDSEMTQSKLASNLEMTSPHLSEVLYFNIKQNFYTFINSYRILESKKLMKNPNYKHSKIIAIAFDSGFKSKTTFNRLFKSYTGQTPSDYRKSV